MLISFAFIAYYVVAAIIGLFIAMSMFKWLNQKFNISYFGFAGVISTFGTCWAIGTIATYLLGWVAIAIFIILKIIGAFTGSNAKEKVKS